LNAADKGKVPGTSIAKQQTSGLFSKASSCHNLRLNQDDDTFAFALIFHSAVSPKWKPGLVINGEAIHDDFLRASRLRASPRIR
jgi:hypothetical protein